MECVMCKEQIPDSSTVCPHCEAQVTQTETGTSSAGLGAVIDGLNVSARKKELFHLILKHDLLEHYGIVSLGKAKAAGLPFKDRFAMCTSILAFIFSCLYYFATGMWRKGLILLAFSLIVGVLSEVFERNFTIAALVPSFMAMMMAFGDQYRTKVLKQTFWF